ncbi:MAG: BNR repeat-containing protein [Bacteroidales bacterium]|nr:BNR repeat-containing protein [Bacteroidales bacterium]
MTKFSFSVFMLSFVFMSLNLKAQIKTFITEVDSGYAKTSVNTAIFRQNALTTFRDTQFIAFYDDKGYVILGKRKINPKGISEEKFITVKTPFKMIKPYDAHNVISIAVDGDGFLHLAFDHHNSPLRYLKSTAPFSLQMKEIKKMVTDNPNAKEHEVTYPEFYNFTNGDLLFVYRSVGNTSTINYYETKTQKWHRIVTNLFENHAMLRAYWQITVSEDDVIHVSWLWREVSFDPKTNHGIYYAKSADYGKTWQTVDGDTIRPVFLRREMKPVKEIPQNTNLINQTSMTTDKYDRPYIATYYRGDDSITNYHLIYYDGKEFQDITLGNRKTDFELAGMGTLSIPISRPRLITDGKKIYYFVRDKEQDSKIAVYYTSIKKKGLKPFRYENLTENSYEAWEPCLDTELWKTHKKIHLFVQKTFQKNNEGILNEKPTMVKVLEIKN